MSKNKFFRDANEPSRDIAAMFTHLDKSGHVPEEMRDALRQHAASALSTIPQNIAAIARAVAAASDGGWMDKNDVASATYGIAGLAEQMQGFQALAEQLS